MRLSSTILLLGLLCATPTVALAGPPQLRMAQRDCPSLSDAVERVRRQYNGRIVSAETHVSGNREVHTIKVLTEDGKVKTARIPGCPRGSR